jgi:hypothetical protein
VKRLSWLVLACAFGWFLWFAHPGLSAGLLPDDLTNTYFAWRAPAWKLALSSLLPYGGQERAFGLLVLRGVYEVFGLSARALHVLCFLLLGANLVLAWRLFQRLAGPATAAIALLLFSYNAYLNDLYLNAGTVFDLLCFLCLDLALVLHLERRGGLAAIALLQLLALASKELAIVLPLGLGLYEWLYERERRWRAPLVCAVLSAAFVAARMLLPSAIAANSGYRLNRAPSALLESAAIYLGQATYQGPRLEPVHAFWLIYAAVLAALVLPWRELRWGVVFTLAAALPILAIPPRNLYAMYVPWLGFTLAAASLPGRLLAALSPRRLWPQLALGAALAAALVPAHRGIQYHALHWHRLSDWMGRLPDEQIRPLFPALPKGARVFIEDDPYDRDDWLLTLWFQLRYRDPDLAAVRRKQDYQPEARDYARLVVTRTSAARLPVVSPANPAP